MQDVRVAETDLGTATDKMNKELFSRFLLSFEKEKKSWPLLSALYNPIFVFFKRISTQCNAQKKDR